MSTRRCGAVMLMVSVCVGIAAPVHAQDSTTSAALFDKGLADMEAGRYDLACPAFAESYRLDPQAGALFTLAECEAKQGKVASAMTHYGDYLQVFERMTAAQRLTQRGREAIATEQRKALADRVPTLMLRLPPDAVAGTSVKRDGVMLNAPALGLALPVNPGEHVIEVRLPTGETATSNVTLAEGQKVELELELPKRVAPAASASASVSASVVALPPPAPTTSPAPPPVKSSSTLGWVVGGAGVVALGIGGYYGLRAFSKWDDAKGLCNGTCPSESQTLKNDAENAAMISNIGFGLGLVGIGVGAYMLLSPQTEKTSPAGQARVQVTPLVSSKAAALSVGGAF